MISIKIDKFQGPLFLLLQIIEKEEMDITSIDLSKIADEYLDYIKRSPDILAESMADFLLMAAKLLYIKSKALLPYLLSEEDQEEIDDLKDKLKLYKDFVALSSNIKRIIGQKKFSFSRSSELSLKRRVLITDEFFPPKNVDQRVLKNAFELVLLGLEEGREEKLEEENMKSILSIEDKISFIQKAVSDKIKISFTKILKESKSRSDLVVSFLAVLELLKQRELSFSQDSLFGEIFIEAYDKKDN
jgi:segregation and condensation protein A